MTYSKTGRMSVGGGKLGRVGLTSGTSVGLAACCACLSGIKGSATQGQNVSVTWRRPFSKGKVCSEKKRYVPNNT